MRERSEYGGFVGNVARRSDAADLRGDGLRAFGVAVQHGDARTARGKGARGRGAESGGAAGHDGGAVVDVHQPIAITDGWSSDV